jgi:hypothetical protein
VTRQKVESLRIPRAALPYILLQRTVLQRWNHRILRRVISYECVLVYLESQCRARTISSAYVESVVREYEEVKPHLPAVPRVIADIGCGVALFDVLLAWHYEGKVSPRFLLVDKSQKGKVFYGFEETGAFYSSLEITDRIASLNGIAPSDWITIPAPPRALGPPHGVDLVISLISWGFHYPVSVYLQKVLDSLSEAGVLILDLRKGTDGERLLGESFSKIVVISEDNVKRRIRASHPLHRMAT